VKRLVDVGKAFCALTLTRSLKMQVVGLLLKAERLAAKGEPLTALNRHRTNQRLLSLVG
jgi:hypothetical protein